MSKNPGTVDIHGREYKTVALRVDEFRGEHPDWTIDPTIVEADERIVVMRAEIRDEEGRLRAAGQAEENRTDGKINRTSAMENCETSAVGRALAFLGYAGSEIASADEVAAAINSKPIERNPKGRGYSRTELVKRIMVHVHKMPETEQELWSDKIGEATNNEMLMNLGKEAKAAAERLEVPTY